MMTFVFFSLAAFAGLVYLVVNVVIPLLWPGHLDVGPHCHIQLF